MPIEGIVCRYDCWGEVLPEDCFECLYDIDESLFKFGVKLHSYEWFLEGVIHYVVMGWSCLHRDIITDFVHGMGGILVKECLCILLRPAEGVIGLEHEFVTRNKHDDNYDET